MRSRGPAHREPSHGMRPLPPLLPFPRALRRSLDAVHPVERTETVPVSESVGRVAAEDVRAPIDVPLAARAAMDGYAVRASDTARASPTSPAVLRVIGAVHAGQSPTGRLAPGHGLEVATGAPIPSGADAVAIVEVTERRGRDVWIFAPAARGDHVVPRGDDVGRGARVVRSGDVLTAARIGVLSAVGRTRIRVYGRPRVGILTTGDEIVPPGRSLEAFQVYDVNSKTVAAVVRAHGGEPVVLGSVGDRLPSLRAVLRRARRFDLIVTSGGSSVGAKDLIPDLMAERGKLLFHGIAVKPGRPTAMGLVDGAPIVGLPGFPTSCLMIAHLLVGPIVRRLGRLPPAAPTSVDVPLASDLRSPRDKTEFHPIRLAKGRAVSVQRGSSAITPMALADGYVEIPVGTGLVRRGTVVRVRLF